MTTSVLVMAKSPVPGRVKARLCPPCTPEQAAAIAAAALADTLTAVAACASGRKVLVLDGELPCGVPRGFEVISQRGRGLDERLARAFDDVGGSALAIGMDTPQVSASELDALLGVIGGPERRGVLGPATDGGYWVIGLAAGADPTAVFEGVPMSSPDTGARQEERLRSLGFDIVRAPERRDVDTIDDLVSVAACAPWTRTAAAARALFQTAALTCRR
jgi:glycosyltransferase A (GT-A) superfamily protein (DUF2064 family)